MTLVLFHPSHPIPSLPAAAFCNLQVGLASASLSVPILSVLLVFSLSALLCFLNPLNPLRLELPPVYIYLSIRPCRCFNPRQSSATEGTRLFPSAARLRQRRETQCAGLSKACNNHNAHHTAELFISTTRDDINRRPLHPPWIAIFPPIQASALHNTSITRRLQHHTHRHITCPPPNRRHKYRSQTRFRTVAIPSYRIHMREKAAWARLHWGGRPHKVRFKQQEPRYTSVRWVARGEKRGLGERTGDTQKLARAASSCVQICRCCTTADGHSQ